MCDLCFDFGQMDLVSLYNRFPWPFKPVLIGLALVLKTVVLFLFVELSWPRRIVGSVAINMVGAATVLFCPVWILVAVALGAVGTVPWCGSVAVISATLAATLDVVILRYGFSIGAATTLPVAGRFFLANLLSILLGHSVAIRAALEAEPYS